MTLSSGRAIPFRFVALLFVPLTSLTLAGAYVVWSGLNWVVLFGLVALWLVKKPGWSWQERVLWGVGAVSFGPAYYNQWQGQVSLALTLALSLGWLQLSRGRELTAGVCLAWLFVKPQYAPLWPLLFLWKRRWRALAGFALGSVLLLSVSLLPVGPSGLLGWLGLVPGIPTLGAEYGVFPHTMYSWSGLASALSGGASVLSAGLAPFSAWLGLCGGTLALIALAWRGPWRSDESRQGGRYAVTIVASVLLSPHTNYQDLTMLLVVGFLSWGMLRRQQGLQLPLAAWTWLFLGTYVLAIMIFFLGPFLVSPVIRSSQLWLAYS